MPLSVDNVSKMMSHELKGDIERLTRTLTLLLPMLDGLMFYACRLWLGAEFTSPPQINPDSVGNT